ncbi:MAG: secondary thiamine-phosphate synthase enzyme YjbQ [Candidatus Nezhaarchaeales archaeon]
MLNVFFYEFEVSTGSRVELIDISGNVENAVKRSGVKDGICLVYAPHATVAIVVNEHEAGLMRDVIAKAEHDYPRGAGWLHDRIDDNANAHLASAFIGSARVFPVKGGALIRGTWQNVFLLEMDGPRRSRRVIVEVLGV